MPNLFSLGSYFSQNPKSHSTRLKLNNHVPKPEALWVQSQCVCGAWTDFFQELC